MTVYFWITKVLTTGMGEATSDYLVHHFNREIAVVFGFTAFVAAMALQFFVRRYVTWIYWLAVAMVAVFGTMAADVLHVGLHVPYWASSVFYAVVLALIFVAWRRSEGTLSIHSIYTRRRETFYWATVLATFALGTAAGDWTARTVGLGYFGSGVMFLVVITIPAVAHWRFGMNAIAAFWFAYIVTRPLGASFADWLAWPHSASGLGLGHGAVSLYSTVIIGGLVAYMSVTGKDIAVRRAASGQLAEPAADRQPDALDRSSQAGRHRRTKMPLREVRADRGGGPRVPEPADDQAW
ncbi:MAG TPA: hypothetical protein VF951_08090 [Streptosporangiaceae bacterium]